MILKSSFGEISTPVILAEALRQSVRELARMNYDVPEIITFLTRAMAEPETWINEQVKQFTLEEFALAHFGDKKC